MAITKKGRYIDKFLRRADQAIQDGVKKADAVLDDALEVGAITTKQASQAAKELKDKAKKESDALHARGVKKISQGIAAAKGSPKEGDTLDVLEKLGKLRKAGIITQKEFLEKKKKLLDRI